MSRFLQTSGPWASEWLENLWRASWQGAIVLAVAWAIARWCTFLSPRVVCWMWRLAALKLLVALLWAQPISLALMPAEARVPRPAPTFASFAAPRTMPQEAMTVEKVVSPEPKPAPVRSTPLLPLVTCFLWLIGLIACVVLTVRQWRSANRLLRSAATVTEERLLAMCREEAARLGIRRLPRLCSAARVESPLLIGVGRPVIILPERASTQFDESELRLMIAHELAHLGRHDLAWNWLPTLARCLFFFHPLVWVMLRRWSEAQEAACDELLIQRQIAGPADYGRMLLKLAARSAVDPQAPLVAAGVLGAYRNLERRILSMARVRPFSARRIIVAAGVVVLAAPVALVPWQLVAAQPSEPAPVVAGSERVGDGAKRSSEVTLAVQQVLDRLKRSGPLKSHPTGLD
jgi:beta-lactamase regulating signal transducer with metallopeptidase domain